MFGKFLRKYSTQTSEIRHLQNYNSEENARKDGERILAVLLPLSLWGVFQETKYCYCNEKGIFSHSVVGNKDWLFLGALLWQDF